MRLVLNYLLLFILFFLHDNLFGQKKVQITVELPIGIFQSKMKLLFDDGQYLKSINPVIVNNTFNISENYYSRYATLTFAYPDSTEIDGLPCFSFFIRGNEAHIHFINNNLNHRNPFGNFRLENALTLSDLGDEKYREFISKESDDAKNYYLKYRDSLRLNKKYRSILEYKNEKEYFKILEYIALYPSQYYSLLIFKNEISEGSSLKADSLIHFFHQTFPDSLKRTYEGNVIEKRLNGRINTKKWGEAPEFIAQDIHGKIISLKAMHGKYVLLDFWASWCAPCMTEIPIIKSIREKYPKEFLEIISISLDKTYSNFNTAIKKTNADWTQIFQGSEIVNQYAIGPVPQVFLISEKGIVIYNRNEEHDPGLVILKKILIQVLEKKEN